MRVGSEGVGLTEAGRSDAAASVVGLLLAPSVGLAVAPSAAGLVVTPPLAGFVVAPSAPGLRDMGESVAGFVKAAPSSGLGMETWR
jgi:hypothetical protein